MPTKPFDQFNKRLFQELLSPFGQVIPNLAVLGSERTIDIFFAPHPGAIPNEDELGKLAKMVTNPALLEPYRSALTDRDLETCVIKLFTLTAELPQDYPQIPIETPPHLWVLAAEVSDRLLNDFKAELDPTLGDGFYLCGKGWRTTIVALEELPNTPETLWLRLMSKGRIQNDAIEELILLRDTDPKRTNALNLLTSWRISIEITGQITTEEERTLMALSQAYLEWEKQTVRRGREEGLEQERRSSIESTMVLRYGAIDEDLRQLIPQLMTLSSPDYMALLLQSSRSELIAHFSTTQ
jgi:hypothetical protein